MAVMLCISMRLQTVSQASFAHVQTRNMARHQLANLQNLGVDQDDRNAKHHVTHGI